MLVPMILMQFGIFRDYWGDFSQNAFSVHVHYWTGTTWYIYLIIQPYFITHGQVERHRTNGIIGMFLAGGVCLTALSMLNRDLGNAQRAGEFVDRFGPFQPWFFMGVAVVEIVMITAFGFAVIKSIIHRRETENHAWWLISTVFIIIMPALGRGVQNVYVGIFQSEWPNIDIMIPIFISEALTIAVLLLVAWKYNRLMHPATYLAIGVNLFNCLIEPIGRQEWIQDFLKATIKG
jgi:hypothetical protein